MNIKTINKKSFDATSYNYKCFFLNKCNWIIVVNNSYLLIIILIQINIKCPDFKAALFQPNNRFTLAHLQKNANERRNISDWLINKPSRPRATGCFSVLPPVWGLGSFGNSSAAKVELGGGGGSSRRRRRRRDRNWPASVHCIHVCFSANWLSQINLSAPRAEVAGFLGAWPRLRLNGPEIDIDLLVCSTAAEVIHFNKKVENTAQGEQGWGEP